jgi:hypothetical protein
MLFEVDIHMFRFLWLQMDQRNTSLTYEVMAIFIIIWNKYIFIS